MYGVCLRRGTVPDKGPGGGLIVSDVDPTSTTTTMWTVSLPPPPLLRQRTAVRQGHGDSYITSRTSSLGSGSSLIHGSKLCFLHGLTVCYSAIRYMLPFGPGRPQRLTLRRHTTTSTMYPPLLLVVLLASTVFRIAEACSSRSTPKPRPPTPTVRPNITFQTYACPEAYAKWYCLNGATCFAVKIRDSILYNCECADGYMGQRCEFKDLDGSYLPSRERVMIETASIAGGVTIAVLLVVLVSLTFYMHVRRRRKLISAYPHIIENKRAYLTASLYDPTRHMDPELGHNRLAYPLPVHHLSPSIATISRASIP